MLGRARFFRHASSALSDVCAHFCAAYALPLQRDRLHTGRWRMLLSFFFFFVNRFASILSFRVRKKESEVIVEAKIKATKQRSQTLLASDDAVGNAETRLRAARFTCAGGRHRSTAGVTRLQSRQGRVFVPLVATSLFSRKLIQPLIHYRWWEAINDGQRSPTVWRPHTNQLLLPRRHFWWNLFACLVFLGSRESICAGRTVKILLHSARRIAQVLLWRENKPNLKFLNALVICYLRREINKQCICF